MEVCPTKKMYGHLFLIKQTIQVRSTRHAGNCWKSKDDSCDVFLWTPSQERSSVSRLAKTNMPLLVRILDAVWMICQQRWLIGMSGEGESGKPELSGRLDNDDD